MSQVIINEINKAKEELNRPTMSDDRAFSHVILKYMFEVKYSDQVDNVTKTDGDIGGVTDGQNDGGIDFVYYDDEEQSIILGQSKYTGNLTNDNIVKELDKMKSTIKNFTETHQTGRYNDRLKEILQNALDRLPEDNSGNIEYRLFTTAQVNKTNALTYAANNLADPIPLDSIDIVLLPDIENEILKAQETLTTVDYYKIDLDKANNCLKYENSKTKGVVVNASSSSIIALYNLAKNKGLFDLNIRRFIRNTVVDSGINRTLDNDREDFWFLNNGIIIACEDFTVDGNVAKLEKFSIVNGGQTTTLIGNYTGRNNQEFFIPCKIVALKQENHGNQESRVFFNKIAEATNSQKPIQLKDLRSNSSEMIRLQNLLKNKRIFLSIKRGIKAPTNMYVLKNDVLGQIILSYVMQKPGTSRSGKKTIFESKELYTRIYKEDYARDVEKQAFLFDLIDLYRRYLTVEEGYKTGGMDKQKQEILKNGTQVIISLFGLLYRLVNNDISIDELNEDIELLRTKPFVWGGFLSNYTSDDIDLKIKRLVFDCVVILESLYRTALIGNEVTSVSNFFKTDKTYLERIVKGFIDQFQMITGDDIKANWDVLKR